MHLYRRGEAEENLLAPHATFVGLPTPTSRIRGSLPSAVFALGGVE